MRKILLTVVLMAAVPAFAQSPPPSDESIRKLMELTDGESVMQSAWGQLDGIMEKSMKDAIGDKPVTAKQEKIMAEFREKTIKVIREEMSWEKLEPIYIKLYRETYTQAELDGMIDFYQSDAGKAVVAKMPQLTQALMQTIVTLMQDVMPKVRALGTEYARKIRETAN